MLLYVPDTIKMMFVFLSSTARVSQYHAQYKKMSVTIHADVKKPIDGCIVLLGSANTIHNTQKIVCRYQRLCRETIDKCKLFHVNWIY